MSDPSRTDALAYVARPDLMEAFADSVSVLYFENGIVHLEMTVDRPDDAGATPRTGTKVAAVRVAMPLAGFVALFDRSRELAQALQSNGIIKIGANSNA